MTAVGTVHGRMAVGHPVDVASGDFFTTHRDHVAPGVVPLSLTRHYNTRLLASGALLPAKVAGEGPFGPGWRAGWSASLRQTLDGFTYTRPDGVELAMRDPSGDALQRSGRLFAPGHGIELRRVDESRVRLVGYGWDRSAVSLLFEAQTGHPGYRLISVERTHAARVDLLWDAERVTELVQWREGRRYHFTYERDRLVAVDLSLRDGTARRIAEYGYDAGGRLVSAADDRGLRHRYTYDAESRMIGEAARSGSDYTVRYGRDGRCVYVSGSDRYQERTLRFDVDGQRTWVVDSHGHATRYEWNEIGQVTRTVSPTGVEMRYEYDELGRVARQVLPHGGVVSHEYDELGRLVVARFPGRETRIRHDDEHRIERYEESNGTTTTYRYDAEHNPIEIRVGETAAWTYGYTPFGEVSWVRSPIGAVATITYDANGGVLSETNWDGATWEWTRDALARAVAEKDPEGHLRRLEYLDEQGSARLFEPDGRVYERHVSADGRTVTLVLPGGATRALQLSACGQPLEYRDELGATTHVRWGTEPGELLAIRNQNGDEYRITYDADMRVVERRTFDGRHLRLEWAADRVVAVHDAAGDRVAYEYDDRGFLARRTSREGVTVYEHDDRGRLAQVTTPDSALRFEYDELGRIVAEEQDGVRVTRALDALGRPLVHTTPFGPETRFTWSAGGACLGIRHGNRTIRYRRDGLGRETERELDDIGTLRQAFDPGGRLVGQWLARPGQTSAALGRRMAYDASGRLASLQEDGWFGEQLLHNPRGDLVGVLRPGGTSELIVPDANGNRLLQARTADGNAVLGIVTDPTLATSMASMLQQAQQLGDADRFVYAPGDRLLRVDGARASIDLAYDANGQVVAKKVHRGADVDLWTYAWNSLGQLIGLTTPNGKSWTYRYDGCGRRIEKRSPTGDVWRFVWIADQLAHVLKNGEVVETYVHEPGGGCPVLRDDGDAFYILPDVNEAPTAELNEAGEISWRSHKGIWGESFSATGPSGGEPFLGQWHDRESGLSYNLFRYYDPDLGRYVSPDPIDLLGGIHPYSYVVDPYTQYDLYGLALTPTSSKRNPGPYAPSQVDTSGVRRGPLLTGPNRGEERGSYGGTAVITHPGGATESVSMSGNTMVTVSQGGQPAFHTFNGTNGATSKPATMAPEVSSLTWNHGEQVAFNELLRGNRQFDPAGGPIRVEISRPPCAGCDPTIDTLARAAEQRHGVPVEVDWPPPASDGRAKYPHHHSGTCQA